MSPWMVLSRSRICVAFVSLVVSGGIFVLTWHVNYRSVPTMIHHKNEPERHSPLREARPPFVQKTAEEGTFNITEQNEPTEAMEGNPKQILGGAVPVSSQRNVTSALDLKCVHTDDECFISQERIRKGKQLFSLSAVLPHGGNTLPNFLLRGIKLGITPSVYQNGILGFLHLNKAAGTSMKACVTGMIEQGILRGHSLMVISNKQLSEFSMKDIMKHNVFEGDHVFGLCEHSGGASCSYFTFLRDPYDRALSAYFYCRARPDQLCGPLKVRNFTIRQWVVYQGSYFFYQLLMDKKYCERNQVIADLLRYGMEDSSLIPPGTSKYISLETVTMCWFKQRVYLETFVNDTGREAILQIVLDNLESWFSLIGLTEEYDLSLKMLGATYNLPFYERCRGKVQNKTPVRDSNNKEQEREQLKLELKSSPEVAEALKYDIRIYEKGRELFQRQKEQFEILMKGKEGV